MERQRLLAAGCAELGDLAGLTPAELAQAVGGAPSPALLALRSSASRRLAPRSSGRRGANGAPAPFGCRLLKVKRPRGGHARRACPSRRRRALTSSAGIEEQRRQRQRRYGSAHSGSADNGSVNRGSANSGGAGNDSANSGSANNGSADNGSANSGRADNGSVSGSQRRKWQRRQWQRRQWQRRR